MSQATISNENSSDRCIGFNVSAPISELETINAEALKAGISRSEWIRRAVKHYLLSYAPKVDT